MSTTIYDYAIIGAGAAGLHLACAMLGEKWFADKKILILEKSEKREDDKTWSFWEKGKGNWADIIAQSWEKGTFYGKDTVIDLNLAPYRYKTLHSIDFYNYCIKHIQSFANVDWVLEEVVKVITKEGTPVIKGKQNNYLAVQVFDSRIEQGEVDPSKYAYLAQHFKGWEIETKDPYFDVSSFVMMDYRVQWKDTTSFTYVLPYSPTRAMVEFTLFTPDLIEKAAYDQPLKQYIADILQIKDYTIHKEEYGIIPMTTFPYHQASRKGLFKIGTAGSWVKPSSGYAFKNIERCAKQLVQNIIQNRPLPYQLLSSRFKFYDAILLEVLVHQNDLGPSIFTDMYRKNSMQQIFKFLDEETSLLEELSIIHSFKYAPFLKGLLRYIT